MPCFAPLKGFRSKTVSDNGKRKIVFNANQGFADMPLTIPCGQCVGCRLERSRQWAVRCTHEASLYEQNAFITLTYDEYNLPEDKSLNVRHFQLFMKRLRKKTGTKIRFYHCGEYGEKFGRPHYHACLFNYDFSDKKPWKKVNGQQLYTSENLDEIWGLGFTSIGTVTFESAAYVARYIMKKVTGDPAAKHYEWVDPETGEVHKRKPEYTTMSRRPGLGQGWLDKYRTDVYPSDEVIMNGKRMKPPKFYDKKQEIEYPREYEDTRFERIIRAKGHAENNTPARLKVRETVQKARLSLLPRELEI